MLAACGHLAVGASPTRVARAHVRLNAEAVPTAVVAAHDLARDTGEALGAFACLSGAITHAVASAVMRAANADAAVVAAPSSRADALTTSTVACAGAVVGAEAVGAVGAGPAEGAHAQTTEHAAAVARRRVRRVRAVARFRACEVIARGSTPPGRALASVGRGALAAAGAMVDP